MAETILQRRKAVTEAFGQLMQVSPQEADRWLIEQINRFPLVLLDALRQNPGLLHWALLPAPALRRKLLVKVKGTRGHPRHPVIARKLVKALDHSLQMQGWDKDSARQKRIAEIMLTPPYRDLVDPVPVGQIREILKPRQKRNP